MLTYITEKLKAHSLEDVQPFQQTELEDRDSGTESDDENAELQALVEAMQDCKDRMESRRRYGSQSAVAYLTQVEPTHSLSPPPLPKLRPITLVNHGGIRLAYSNNFVERPSSEEELAIINGHPAEKRKWSQVTRCGSCSDDSCSSDDEVRDLLSASPKPLTFSAAPPRGIRRMTKTMPPSVFLSRMSPSLQICSVSPRKRHRQTYGSDVSEATVMQRPCLDFEKMQGVRVI
jgi:hypothetical protein